MSRYDDYEKNQDPTPRPRHRYDNFTGQTVSDLLAWVEERGLDPDSVSLVHRYVSWWDEETPEEILSRIAHSKKTQAGHLEFVRQAYKEYKRRGLFRKDGKS